MSESSATVRAFSSADEFERRLRALDPTAQRDDPLAELARLVGQEDPFRGLKAPVREVPAAEETSIEDFERRYIGDHHDTDFSDFEGDFAASGLDIAGEPGAPTDPAVVHGAVEPVYPVAVKPAYAPISVREPRAAETSADAWARGDDDIAATREPEPLTATRDEPFAEPSAGSKRTLIVLAAVVVLTGGGLAASFLARPSGTMTATATTAAPTILAAAGPSKVQPETAPTDAGAPSQPSTLLDKNNSDGTATAKVVDSVEQPVDLNQAIKAAPGAAQSADASPAVAPNASSPFPEPRKVKTVLIRPDGTVIADAPPAEPASTAPAQPNLAFDTHMTLAPSTPKAADAPPAATAPAAPAAVDPLAPLTLPQAAQPSGKSQARVATTPKPVGAKTADAATPGHTPTVTPKVKPTTPAPRPAAKAKPAEVADATPTATSAASPAVGGGYSVQLGAPPSEAEAKDVSAKLVKKYADQLGAYRPAIHKADAGGKTVYRIRVGNLSSDEAKALCSKLQAGGGGCFVARN